MTRAICPLCAREYPEGDTCKACGSPLTLIACSHCEAINAIDAVRCHQCGASFAPRAARVEMGAVAADARPPGPTVDEPTPIAFAERVEYAHRVFDEQRVSHEQRLAKAPPPSEALPIERRVPTERDARKNAAARAAPAHRRGGRAIHVGSAITLVFAVAASAYYALDVPVVQRVVSGTAAWLDVRALSAARGGVAPAPASGPATAPRSPAPRQAPPLVEEGSTAKAPVQRERAANEDPAVPSEVETAQAAAPRTVPPMQTHVGRPPRHRPRAEPPPVASKDALATKQLIERDLAKFRQP